MEIKEKVYQAVSEIQNLSGEDDQDIDSQTIPIRHLKGFDSLRGVEVTILLEELLGIEIEGNLFVMNQKPLSLGEIIVYLTKNFFNTKKQEK